ncbi:hypothetical protein QNO07_22025 [Streptomyces sp. 549]|uniref:DUF7848 domain-containing protein n=1 Tax=Streptomyces sp. 549 TaxID=3049076 RepID=UPI0024C32D62|nr:hypothetical protein [Streptomyces sp. 549]MDK1476064.1 hypothetical protein [Streptomyces sp. 549]
MQWSVGPDREPDAEAVTYAMECAVCGARSQPRVDAGDGQQWVFAHAGRNPSHHTYREHITRPYRAVMTRTAP